jgi:hypothetical protein
MKQARRKERRRYGKRKGQFFILGAVLICMLFFVGLPLYGPQLQSYREDLSFVSSNLEPEFPRALNLGLKEGSGTAGLADFSAFSRDILAGQNVRLRALWVVSEPYGADLLVTVGNFMGAGQTVNVTVGGDSRTLFVQDNSTEIAVFPGVPDSFQITVGFPGHSRTADWVRGKVSLYAFIEASRGNDVAAKEIEA